MYKDAFIQHLHMHYQPFQTHFSCVPANPIVIHGILQDMYSKWQSGSIQEHLSVRASFYEIIYHVFRELVEGQGKPHEIDKAEAARLFHLRLLQNIFTYHYIDNDYQFQYTYIK